MLRQIILSAFTTCISVTSATGANYSVQLIENIAPAGWSAEQWASAADSMISKTQAYILTDLIEDLAIKLKISEDGLRQSINQERDSLYLSPLPPPKDKPSVFDAIRMKYYEEPKQDISTYLPPNWTEEKLANHTSSERTSLPLEVQELLTQRLNHEQTLAEEDPNQGFLSELPRKVLKQIITQTHAAAQQLLHLPSSVRAYKRSIAPLVAIVGVQSYEEFGFLLYRTSYQNSSAWETFMDNLNDAMEAQFEEGDLFGIGLEAIAPEFLMPLEDDPTLHLGSAADCRSRFLSLRAQGVVPYGLDTGVVLMADERSIASLNEFDERNPPHVWAVDVEYDPETKDYPAGYEGVFEVRTHALIHGLYVALGSGFMNPVEVWELTQRYKREGVVGREEVERGHDEL